MSRRSTVVAAIGLALMFSQSSFGQQMSSANGVDIPAKPELVKVKGTDSRKETDSKKPTEKTSTAAAPKAAASASIKIGGLTVTGSVRARFENWDWVDTNAADGDYSFDLWYMGGGAFQKGTFGYVGRPSNGERTLGTLVDFSADFLVAPKSTLTFYIAGLHGGGVASKIYPLGSNARYAYVEFSQKF